MEICRQTQGKQFSFRKQWKGVWFPTCPRARHSRGVTFLHTQWITDQPEMLLINTSRTWSRGSSPYLRDKQHSDKHSPSNHNTIAGDSSKSKHRRCLFSAPLLFPCVRLFLFIKLTHKFCFFFETMAHLLPKCVLACFCQCASVFVCVCVCAGL